MSAPCGSYQPPPWHAHPDVWGGVYILGASMVCMLLVVGMLFFLDANAEKRRRPAGA